MAARKTTRSTAKRKSPSTQAGKYVREEIEHVRQGKHGARSAKQAIAIGLSKARKAGVKLPPRPGAKATKTTTKRKPNPTRSRATKRALKREGTAAASHRALSRQAGRSARQRTASSRSAAARKAARTKGSAVRHRAAVKAAATRARRAAR